MTTPTPIPDFCVSSNADGFDEFLKVLSEYCKTIGYLNGAHRYYGLSSGGLDCGSQAWTTNELTPHAAIALLTAKPLTEGLVRGNNFECIESFLSFRDEVMYKKGKEYKCDVDGMLRNEHGTLDNLDKTLLNRHFKLLPTTQEDFKIPVTESEVEQFEKDFPIDVYLSESKSEEMRKNILNSTQEEKVNAKIDSLTSQLVQSSLEDELKMSDNPKLKNFGEHISTQEESVKADYYAAEKDFLNKFWTAGNHEDHVLQDVYVALKEYSTQQTAHLQQQLKEANLLLLNIKNTIELNNIQKVFPETYPQINQFLILNQ